MNKYNLDKLKEIAKNKKGYCLSSEYINGKTNILWRCIEGHEWKASLNRIQQGSWCPYCSKKEGAKKRRISFTEIEKVIKGKGGKFVSGNYVDTTSSIECCCDKNHKWATTGNRIRRGCWCPICARKINSDKMRLPIAETEKLIKQKGGKIVFIFNEVKIKIECDKGHVWNTTIQRVRRDHWCPVCSAKSRGLLKRLSLQDAREAAKKLGGECLSDSYKNTAQKLKWKCKKGHVWEAPLTSVRWGHWCIVCAGKKKYTIEDMKEYAKKHKAVCLSEKYTNANTSLLWECEKGHKWPARFADLRDFWACPVCSGRAKLTIEEMKRVANKRGGECLSKEYKNNNTKLLWKCKKGHEFWMKYNAIQAQGSWCPICLDSKEETHCREIFEDFFCKKFIKSKPRWLKPEGFGRLELDGYCEELNLAFEYNGLQHYKKAYYDKSDNDFKTRVVRDKLKIGLCKDRGVNLIIIPQIGRKIRGYPLVTRKNVKDYILNQINNLL